MNEQLREIGRNAELAAARAEGRLEVWREIAAIDPWVEIDPDPLPRWCRFCECFEPMHQDSPELTCLFLRAVEATREPERR